MKTAFMLLGLAIAIGLYPSSVRAQQSSKPSTKSTISDYGMRAYGLAGITLSEAQKAQLEAVRKEYIARYKAFTFSLNDDDLKNGKRRLNQGELASLKGISQSQFGAIRKILTQGQRQQFDENIRKMEADSNSVEKPSRIVSRDSTISALIPTPRSKTQRKGAEVQQ